MIFKKQEEFLRAVKALPIIGNLWGQEGVSKAKFERGKRPKRKILQAAEKGEEQTLWPFSSFTVKRSFNRENDGPIRKNWPGRW